MTSYCFCNYKMNFGERLFFSKNARICFEMDVEQGGGGYLYNIVHVHLGREKFGTSRIILDKGSYTRGATETKAAMHVG